MGPQKGPMDVAAFSHHDLPHNCLRANRVSSEKLIKQWKIGGKMSALSAPATTRHRPPGGSPPNWLNFRKA